jgi:hypothetical protein
MHSPLRNGKAPLDLFSQVASTSTPKYFYPFGCPVYVLTKPDGKGLKWEEQACIGINLGNSPTHARSVSLVLNIETGLVSPQFHVKFDDMFETVSSQQLQIKWQQRTGFKKSDEPAPKEPPVPDMYLLPLQETKQTADAPAQVAETPVHETTPPAAGILQTQEGDNTATSSNRVSFDVAWYPELTRKIRIARGGCKP